MGGAVIAWSLYPFYFRLLADVPLAEVTAHRVVWSTLVLAWWAPHADGAAHTLEQLRSPRRLAMLALTGLLLFTTWLAYVYAVISGRVLDASLGYFLAPLVAVTSGVLLLGERMRAWQLVAVALAGVAVGAYMLRLGELPGLALILALTFAIYGALRKKLGTRPLTGLYVECLTVLPLALAYLAWLTWEGQLVFWHRSHLTDLWLVASGIVTVAPLWCFHLGARQLDYVTVGLMLYIAPTVIFLEAIWLFGEPMDETRALTFAIIWVALALYTIEGAWVARRRT